ncbi:MULTISPECIES: enolase C-terminal domain-like protein [Ramlibacter]|uniref:Mandelate racemase n=1 Tax=Ramlibacter pinisoli TaxID=2682844 RepID=A0A6N8IWV5_9BURK|nr:MULTISPECIES: enolase C-terminal domain-like protein [Ramlibacter]MBA2965507.1 mandelate racemase [Ramlibacter sp. CGMCC 1.13660]MVQ30473.1 mandelate racemase [Ramlibacter pinisoli]
MAEAPALRLRAIELAERPVRLRLPFRFGVVTLTECPQAFVRVRIEDAAGRSQWGAAAEMMAPKWFDKNLQLSNADNFEQLRAVLRLARAAYLADTTPASAFGHFARHQAAHQAAAAAQGFNPLLASYGPALLDRAILDALCRLQGVAFAAALRHNLPGISGDVHPAFAGVGIEALLPGLRESGRIEARHTVGMVDAITAADVGARVGDGLPETLEEVVARYGHRWFKLKVGGRLAADLDRLVAIAAVLDRSPAPYFVSLDGNEQYASAAGVAELVAGIRATPALARLWSAVAFIEQPIARALALEEDLRGADLGKPVIIDESDGELDAFVQARARGYAGVSSKTCKGLYRSLLNAARCAAWNRADGGTRHFLSAEDLTTQAGLSVQQDLALVDLLGITHVERNGHHYVNGMAALPAAEQQAFLAAHPDLYEHSHGAVRLAIRDGVIRLASLHGVGYASGAMPQWDAMQPIAG